MTVVLLAAALATSTLSGFLGMGGGILLLAIMAQYFPLQVLIPLHGIIQLTSNGSRTFFSLKDVNLRITRQYAIGALVGAAVGSQFVVQVPENPYKIGMGAFILGVTFLPLPRLRQPPRLKWQLVGAGSTFLGLFVGATGPLIAPFYLSEKLSKENLIATKASTQVLTHLLKILTYFGLGFSLRQYLGLLAGMLAMVVLGSFVGKLVLHRLSEKWFLLLFKCLIAILSARMIWQGFKAI